MAEEITDRVRRLDDNVSRCDSQHLLDDGNEIFLILCRFYDSTLESWNLPAALDALDRPIGLPPSLVKKAEEVRLDSGPERVETSVRDVQTLSGHALALLDEVRLEH